ncbi:MAG: YiiX/YebB-like N1pC/P60 family cysteine hydrolase [Candidatus Eremiobacteraeota bacterium]|nr:YiiX/YebB-like N1pC/P60 family cysteine hydrolase [Candidatus Eremiobacteraeota bacterium]
MKEIMNSPNAHYRAISPSASKGIPKEANGEQVVSCFSADSLALSGTGGSLKQKMGGFFTDRILNIRVPTTTQKFPEDEKKKVLDLLQPGDIFLETNDAYPNWQVLEKIVFSSDYTHAAIYEGNGQLLEASSEVQRRDVNEYLNDRANIAIIRPPYKTEDDKKAALDYARAQLGKPYDDVFDQNDDSAFYCVELVQKALKAMPNPIETPLTTFMGKPYVGPNAFQKIEGAQLVYNRNGGFLNSMMSHYPVTGAAVAGAIAAGLALGPVGALAGLMAGGTLATMVGNKIQAGKFSLYE